LLAYGDEGDSHEEGYPNVLDATEPDMDDETAELQRAIAMSLSKDGETTVGEEGDQEITAEAKVEVHPGNNGLDIVDTSAHDNAGPAYDSDNEEEILNYAIAASLAEDDQNLVDMESLVRGESSSSSHQHTNRSQQTAENASRSCAACRSCPRFPARKKPRTFRIIQFGTNEPCDHYVAVSYCWPKDEDGNPITADRLYRVITSDKEGVQTERSNRAPDEVIDRAVDFARSECLRLIWFDQECLP
jgi:Ubiquitin interaction motif